MVPGLRGAACQADGRVVVIAYPNVIGSVDRPPPRRDRVVLYHGRFACIGPTAQCPTPANAQVIEARGKWDGLVTEPQAIEVGRGVLRDNARRLYGWK